MLYVKMYAQHILLLWTPRMFWVLLFVGQDQLGEIYLTYSHIWGSQNSLGKKMHYIFGILRPLQINHVCENFHPHGSVQKFLAATLIDVTH